MDEVFLSPSSQPNFSTFSDCGLSPEPCGCQPSRKCNWVPSLWTWSPPSLRLGCGDKHGWGQRPFCKAWRQTYGFPHESLPWKGQGTKRSISSVIFLLPLFKPLSTNKILSPEMLTFLMEVQQSLIMRAGERSGGGKRGRCHILCLTIHSKPSHQVNTLLRITFFLFLLSHFQNSNLKNIDLFLQVGCSKGGVT